MAFLVAAALLRDLGLCLGEGGFSSFAGGHYLEAQFRHGVDSRFIPRNHSKHARGHAAGQARGSREHRGEELPDDLTQIFVLRRFVRLQDTKSSLWKEVQKLLRCHSHAPELREGVLAKNAPKRLEDQHSLLLHFASIFGLSSALPAALVLRAHLLFRGLMKSLLHRKGGAQEVDAHHQSSRSVLARFLLLRPPQLIRKPPHHFDELVYESHAERLAEISHARHEADQRVERISVRQRRRGGRRVHDARHSSIERLVLLAVRLPPHIEYTSDVVPLRMRLEEVLQPSGNDENHARRLRPDDGFGDRLQRLRQKALS
eukprot:scaffold870_cov268-Pinguiococcus_pyrenoidosus.AAC.15